MDHAIANGRFVNDANLRIADNECLVWSMPVPLAREIRRECRNVIVESSLECDDIWTPALPTTKLMPRNPKIFLTHHVLPIRYANERPPPQDSFDPPVIIRLYETYRTFLPIRTQFPKLHRYTIGEAIDRRILTALECVFEANAMPRPLRELPLLKALAAAECAALLLRCCVEVRILEMTPYLQLTALLREVRKMLHGWIAYVRSGPNVPR